MPRAPPVAPEYCTQRSSHPRTPAGGLLSSKRITNNTSTCIHCVASPARALPALTAQRAPLLLNHHPLRAPARMRGHLALPPGLASATSALALRACHFLEPILQLPPRVASFRPMRRPRAIAARACRLVTFWGPCGRAPHEHAQPAAFAPPPGAPPRRAQKRAPKSPTMLTPKKSPRISLI